MQSSTTLLPVTLLTIATFAVSCTDTGDSSTTDTAVDQEPDATSDPTQLRVATFNASLYRDSRGQLADDLQGGDDQQAAKVAEIIQRVRPDILLVNEFDWDADGSAARLFVDEYLGVGQNDADAIEFEHRYVPGTNTGVHSGVDLNGDGEVVSTPGKEGYGDDAHGFGVFPGQYGMLVLSRHPIVDSEVRTFRELRWKAMPENLMPTDWYSDEAVETLRLSSKNHVDLPVDVGGDQLHLLASHPTPPSFDGPEDRNGRRNHDEIRFWRDYLSPGQRDGYIVDDRGNAGGLPSDAPFVVAGDLNNDPNDGDGRSEAIRALLDHPRVTDPEPSSEGGERAAESDGGVNGSHDGDPALDTADFSDQRVGNLRMDYVLPSQNLAVEDADVFWPTPGDEHADLVDASDHRLVWVDVTIGHRD
jgi:endonuclease/exonuclease/phosphatase family metal-dependent hydrolase